MCAVKRLFRAFDTDSGVITHQAASSSQRFRNVIAGNSDFDTIPGKGPTRYSYSELLQSCDLAKI